MNDLSTLTDDALLDRLQRGAFAYFLDTVEPSNGLTPDTDRPNSPVSIAVVGFGLSLYPSAIARGWIARAEAAARTLAVLRFFQQSEQSSEPDATGYRGFYYHFLDIHSGRRTWQSELSMIDTTFLIAGMLVAAGGFDGSDPVETEIRAIADALYRRVDWPWAQDGHTTICQGWKPESGFLHYGWEGYSEALLLYTLALGSPTHPLATKSFAYWSSTYQWENLYHQDVLYAGPMFVHHFSHAWLDLRGIRDAFMREKNSDYFENSRRAIAVQREYAKRNPRAFVGYGENGWGLSACDGPSDGTSYESTTPRRLFGYAARGVPYGPDDGTLCPSAVLGSVPFAPDTSLGGLRNLLARYPQIVRDDRLVSSFNPSLRDADGRFWISEGHFGLDQGIAGMMIENHRTGSIWALMRRCPYVIDGLRRGGFDGGWLDERGSAA